MVDKCTRCKVCFTLDVENVAVLQIVQIAIHDTMESNSI